MASSTSSTPAPRRCIAVDLTHRTRRTIASGLPVGAPPGVTPKPLLGMPPFSGPQGPFAGHRRRTGRHALCLGRRRRQRAAPPRAAPDATRPSHERRPPLPAGRPHAAPGDRRRRISRRIPTAHRTRTVRPILGQPLHVREALRRLREDNLVASRPTGRHPVVPRTTSSSYAQDVMSINDLMAFATGAASSIQANTMLTMDAELSARTGLPLGEEWLAVRGFRQVEGARDPICCTEYYINRAFASVGGYCNATPGRSSRSSRTCSVSASSRCTRRSPRSRRANSAPLEVDPGTPALEMHRTYRTSDGEIAQVTINTHPGLPLPPLDDVAPGQGLGSGP